MPVAVNEVTGLFFSCAEMCQMLHGSQLQLFQSEWRKQVERYRRICYSTRRHGYRCHGDVNTPDNGHEL